MNERAEHDAPETPEVESDDRFATPSGMVGSPDARATDVTPAADEDERNDLTDESLGTARTSQSTGASGGYGTASGFGSSGGSGEGTDETSAPGEDNQTDWLRDAPGGGDEP